MLTENWPTFKSEGGESDIEEEKDIENKAEELIQKTADIQEKAVEKTDIFEGQDWIQKLVKNELEEISLEGMGVWEKLRSPLESGRGELVLTNEQETEHILSCARNMLIDSFEKELGYKLDDEEFKDKLLRLSPDRRKNIRNSLKQTVSKTEHSLEKEQNQPSFDGWLNKRVPRYMRETVSSLKDIFQNLKGVRDFILLQALDLKEDVIEAKDMPSAKTINLYESILVFLEKKAERIKSEDAEKAFNALLELGGERKKERQITQIEAETSPIAMENNIMTEEEANIFLFETVFGSSWKKEYASLLPDPFLEYVDSVTFKKEIPSTRDWVRDVTGSYNEHTRNIDISTKFFSEQRSFRTLFHEIGHAVDFGEVSGRGNKMRMRFLQAVAQEENHFSAYAVETYAREGLKRGLEEDFAESLGYFFDNPDLLKTLAPERYNATFEIMEKYYPNIDIDRTHSNIEERKLLIQRNPETNKRLVSECGLNGVAALFPSLNLRAIEMITTKGQARKTEKRKITELNTMVTTMFNDSGKILREYMTTPEGKTIELGNNMKYDNLGRLAQFETDLVTIFLKYSGKESTPFEAEVSAKDGRQAYALAYERRNNKIIERIISQPPADINSSVEYDLTLDGQVDRATGLIENQKIFERPYVYDSRGRVVEKSILDSDGRNIAPIHYDYE
ncbi:MAG: hypothetical protein Q7R31_01450 [Candidatus Levybacteria bacterium]|nr:hypothetical protein [Candidatus Levybacteria bacterium]